VGRLLSALIHAVGDFDIAEEALQDAFAAAVVDWAAVAPRNPAPGCTALRGTRPSIGCGGARG